MPCEIHRKPLTLSLCRVPPKFLATVNRLGYIYSPNDVNDSKISQWTSSAVSPFFFAMLCVDSDCASHFETCQRSQK
jgi:hypothetical protein